LIAQQAIKIFGVGPVHSSQDKGRGAADPWEEGTDLVDVGRMEVNGTNSKWGVNSNFPL